MLRSYTLDKVQLAIEFRVGKTESLGPWSRVICCFHPILVTWFLVGFGNKVTKINSLFIFHFVMPVLPWKRKTSYRKSRKKQKRSYQRSCFAHPTVDRIELLSWKYQSVTTKYVYSCAGKSISDLKRILVIHITICEVMKNLNFPSHLS